MNERLVAIMLPWGAVDGTMTGDVTAVVELPYLWTFKCAKACASNDSSATLAASGGITISATAIGDSGDPTEILASTSAPVLVDADESITFTLDFDGSSGTAAANPSVIVFGWVGEGPQ